MWGAHCTIRTPSVNRPRAGETLQRPPPGDARRRAPSAALEAVRETAMAQ